MKKSLRLVFSVLVTATAFCSQLLAGMDPEGIAVNMKNSYSDEAMDQLDGVIVTQPIPGILCQNSATVIRFEASGTFNNDNVFTAQLSDASGSFANPTVISAVPGFGDGVPPFIFGLISAPAGTGYRIRVVSSSPVVIGSDNGTDIVINNQTAPSIPSVTINGPTDFCFGSATTFLTSSYPSGNLWYPGGTNTNPFLGVVSSGCYYTLITAPNGCSSSSVPVCINVNTPIFTFLAYAENDSIVTTADTTVTICEGDSAQIAVIVQGGVPPFDIFYTFDGLGSVLSFNDVGEPFGGDHIFRFYASLPGTYSIVGITDNFPTNCGSNGSSGTVSIQIAPPPVTDFSYNPFCGSPSQPPIPAPGFLGGGVFTFEPQPGDGASVNASTGVVTGAVIGTTYTVKYTVQGPFCEASSSTSFTVNDSDIVSFSVEPFCPKSPSSAPITTPGFVGGGSFAFAVPPGDGATISAVTGIISGATPLATYIISYTSPAGLCQAIGLDTVKTYDTPAISANVVNTLCGDSTGSITTSITGGLPDYSFSWSDPGGTASSLENLPAGSYTLTVTDLNGCKDAKTFNVINTNQPEISIVPSNATCGTSNGSLAVTVTDSPGPFRFTWNDNSSSQNRTNLPAGNYSVTVLDSTTGCSATASTTIANEGAPTAAFTVINSLCEQSVGAIDVTVTGGTGTITHSWSNGLTTEDISGLPAGTYSDTIRDENNCQIIITATVINENQFTASSQVTNPTCGNPNGGSINVTINGGQSPFTFEWTPNTQTLTEDAFNLPAGTYTVKITGAAQCTASVVSVIQPAVNPTLSLSKTDATCGNQDGSVNLTVSGGSGNYVFEWSNGQTTEDISNLTAGKYKVTVKDAIDNDCVATDSITIIFGNKPILSLNVTPSACAISNGKIDLTITNGSGNYEFSWTGPSGFSSTSEDLSDLAIGKYLVKVTDPGTTCEATDSAIVNFENAPQLSAVVVNTTCGLLNGLIDVTITGGENPTVSWSPGNETTQDLVNLSSGEYSITVKDDNNCEVRDTFQIGASLIPTSDLSFTQPTCGNDTARINLTLTNMNTPVIYSWRKNDVVFASTEDVSNLGPGTFRVTATDVNGCLVRDTAVLAYQNLPGLNTEITNTTCGLSEGAVNLEINGGTPDYNFSWTGPDEFTSAEKNISNLKAGCYNVKVTDAGGCEVSAQACVESENAPEIAFETVQPACNQNNGSLTAVITGGATPYTLTWAHTTDDSSTQSALSAGNYTLSISDANGCEVTKSVTLTNTGNPSLTGNQVNTTCGNAIGSIDIQISGGVAPYTYNWTPGDLSTEDIANLSAGTYNVKVTDSRGCEATGSFIIENSDAPQLLFTQVNTTCGKSDGNIDVTVSPTGDYNFLWSGQGVAANAEDQTGLAAGTYKVIVTADGSQCSDSLEISIINSNTFTLTGEVTNTTCGLSNGSIALSITGGEAPFSFIWSCTDAVTEDVTELAAGECEVTVRDNAGCEVSESFTIQNIAGPEASATITDGTCGSCNGAIEVNVTSGTAPFNFLWNDQASAEDRTALCDGNYELTITDSNNCTAKYTYTVNTTVPPGVTVNNTTDSECGKNLGAVDVSVSGGKTPYAFSWSGPNGFTAQTEDISNLFAGSYELLVTDSLGCDSTFTVTIKNADEPTLEFTVTDALCGQTTGSILLDVVPPGGGPLPSDNTYSWTGPNGFTAGTKDLLNVPAGTYEVVVNAGDCEVKGSATIKNTDAPKASISADRQSFCEGEQAEVTIKLTGNPPFTFKYADGSKEETITAFADTTYSFTVNPKVSTTYSLVSLIEVANPSCQGEFTVPSVSITVNPRPEAPVITASGLLAICQGDSVTLTSSYQTGNTWSNGQTAQSIVAKTTGDYIVTVSTQFNCSASDTVTLQVTNTPIVAAGIDSTVCPGQSVQLQASGADTYLWSPSIGLSGTIISNPLASPPETTTYVVTGTNKCGSAKDTITISIKPVVDASLGADRTICSGDTLELNATVVENAVYAWGPSSSVSGPADKADVKFVLTGSSDIYLTTTNSNGCIDTDTIRVTVTPLPQAPVLTVQGDTSICQGGSVVINSTIGTFVRWYSGKQLIAENVSSLEVNKAGDYSVEYYGGNCPVRSNQIKINVINVPVASITPSGSVQLCEGSCVDLYVGNTTGTINWTTPGGNSTDDTLQACKSGKYFLEVSTGACISKDSIEIFVNKFPEPPVISPTGLISICQGQTATLNSSYAQGNQWLKNGSPLSGFTSNYILLNSQGFYSVRYTDENGCSSVSDTVEISIKPLSELIITASDSVICSGSGKDVTLTASSGFETYEWSNGLTGNSINVTTSGTYELTATNSAGCKTSATFVIKEGPAVSTSLFSPIYFDDYNVTKKGAKDGSIDLTVDGGTGPFTYNWGDTTQVTEDLNGLGGGWYTVIVTDQLGCTATDSINLKEPGDIRLPNGFTPNSDGFNDFYVIKGIQGYPGNKITIFNRWGNIVYSTNNYVNDWTGVSNDGNLLPDGTYFIVVDLNENNKLIENFIDLRRNK